MTKTLHSRGAIESQIKLDSLGIANGMSKSIYCPFCDNNPSYSPSLSVTRVEGGLLYNCFRVQCQESGFIGSLDARMKVKESEEDFEPFPLIKRTRTLNANEVTMLCAEYQLTVEEVLDNGFKWLTDHNGLAMPLFTSTGNRYGYCIKYFDGGKMKSCIHLEHNAPKLHFPINKSTESSKTVIIVEDILSAIRVSRFGRGVALLGTNLTTEKAQVIKGLLPNKVVIALDPDAIQKAILLKKRYGMYFRSTEIAALTDDPKDMDHEQLQEELCL